jgi:hypothetical protein
MLRSNENLGPALLLVLDLNLTACLRFYHNMKGIEGNEETQQQNSGSGVNRSNSKSK